MNLYDIKNFLSTLNNLELAIKYLIAEDNIEPEQKFYILDNLKEIEKIIFMSRDEVIDIYFDGDEDNL